MLRDMFKERKHIFSIRKTVLGVGSVLLGGLLTTGFVSAEEIQGSSVADSGLVVASDPAVAQPLVTETVIKSPIRYVDEPAQEVGYSAVQTHTQLQQMERRQFNGLSLLKRLLF